MTSDSVNLFTTATILLLHSVVSQDCGFVRLTGYGFLADPNAIIGQDVLSDRLSLLPNCQIQCLGNSECKAFEINVESLQCVQIRKTWVDEKEFLATWLLAKNNSVVHYKACVKNTTFNDFAHNCSMLWRYNIYRGLTISHQYQRSVRHVMSLEHCIDICQAENTFKCRAASYHYNSQNCKLAVYTGRESKSAVQTVGQDHLYIEDQCMSDTRGICTFKTLNTTAMAFSLVRQAELNESNCQRLCLEATEFNCRTFIYDQETRECLLSPEDFYSLRNSSVFAKPILAKELATCTEVNVTCYTDSIIANFRTTKLVGGRAFVVGSESTCSYDLGRSLAFNISIPIKPIGVRDCAVVEEAENKFSTMLLLQYHPLIMTADDRIFKLMCTYSLGSQMVEDEVELNDPVSTYPPVLVTGSPPPFPQVRMRIINRNGQSVSSAEIGQVLYAEVSLLPQGGQTEYAIFVTDCQAQDDGRTIPLVDKTGCPLNVDLFEGFYPLPSTNQQTLRAAFKGFRFREQQRVNINCNVNFCYRFCEPALCTDSNGRKLMSFGRRRRRSAKTNAVKVPKQPEARKEAEVRRRPVGVSLYIEVKNNRILITQSPIQYENGMIIEMKKSSFQITVQLAVALSSVILLILVTYAMMKLFSFILVNLCRVHLTYVTK